MITKNTAFQSTTVIGPQNTWVWSAVPAGPENVLVECRFGGGSDANNVANATIPTGYTGQMPISSSDPVIFVQGTVTATWLPNNGFIVTFNGIMVEPNVTNTFSTGAHNMIVSVSV
jgi:hypothetical protein